MTSKKSTIKLITIKEQVYNIIKEDIITGKLKPGEWLQETKLAEMLNVSRSPVREVLKELVGEGLLENIPNKGVFVKTLSIKDIYNIFEFREVMEGYAIKKASNLATHEDLETLDQIYIELVKAYENGDVNEYCKIDTKLHDALFIISGNEIIYNIVNNVYPLLQPFRIISLNSKGRFEESLDEHKGIIEGIKEKDYKKSLEFNTKHLNLARDVIIEHIKDLNKEN